MSVRQSLLAILDQGPCYGYQLRNEFDHRTRATWPLNVGQIYNTLERLERDGLVARGDTDEHGHVYWHITDAGSAEVSGWFDTPTRREAPPRDELAIKLALATSLPGVDAAATVASERDAAMARLAQLRHNVPPVSSQPFEDFTHSLITESIMMRTEAEVRWLDDLATRLQSLPVHAQSWPLTTERPARGRPARTPRESAARFS